ncbi:MAG: Na/Pi cotransporter family protein [Gammaproteobacteria bacterium]|nr:Na/Pi cotransporter family protein [Gammaproteobacteria bacterium]MBT4607139.1 Na/Pi cotransporter family protein [Thiotrichales bacterium]MBT3471323.1 Na/Pi cotransporter family protein [Gammaproteobacteria bacterium]MBT3967837.1 Na/Pi cotransporter family protein [Gammaproteobacteria bacterium]MBT4081872.1 Na/Pi cotransporter family protein [Gammaproteobacteria bacterium]
MLFAASLLTLNAYAGGGSISSSEGAMDWWQMGIKLFGGLALFLFGMEQMADSLKAVAGEKMKTILAKLTTNRFTGAITGALVTAVIQSSSVTTVLVVGFISAGLMSMAQSIGVIMGANIGTTITAQIVAFKVTKYALLMIAMGFSMLFFSKQNKIKHYGGMIMGLGLVFFGMSVMSDAMHPLRSYQPFLDLMVEMSNPLLAILIAAGFTALVQSSSATTGIVIVMASQGFITLPAGIALAFGANVGTCVTAMLASIGKPREALRAAAVHVLFNVLGVLLWLGFITQLADVVTTFSPAHPELSGIDRLSAETPRQIANAHTIFNISNTLIFILFTGQFARLVEWMVPDRPLEEEQLITLRHLDEELLSTPSLALNRARMELVQMSGVVEEMHQNILPAIIKGSPSDLQSLAREDQKVDRLHQEIIRYMGQISGNKLSEVEATELSSLFEITNALENIGDLIETDMVELGLQRIEEEINISPQTVSVLQGIHTMVAQSLTSVTAAIKTEHSAEANQVVDMKTEFNLLVNSAHQHQMERLTADESKRIQTYSLEVEVIEKLKRIYYFSKRIAKAAA